MAMVLGDDYFYSAKRKYYFAHLSEEWTNASLL